MEWRRRAERTRVVRQAAELVEESEAFLLGRYLETRARSAAGSPVWTRCNWIAHAAPDEIMAAVAGPARLSGRPGSWAWAAGTLADVHEVHAGRGDAHERLAGAGCGGGRVDERENLGAAEFECAYGFHRPLR